MPSITEALKHLGESAVMTVNLLILEGQVLRVLDKQ